MKRNRKAIRAGDALYPITKQTKTIHEKPFKKLRELIFHATEVMKYPHAYHFCFYLSEEQAAKPNGWSLFLKEFNRRLSKKVTPRHLYFWSKEDISDFRHDGTHYHFLLIAETKGSCGIYHARKILHEMKEQGYLSNYYLNDKQKNPKIGNIKASLKSEEGERDFFDWLSYCCKNETKEGLAGRLYGYSKLAA